MNNNVELQIRDRAELRVQAGESTAVVAVRVQDITPEGIIIDRPVIDQRLMPASRGKEIEIQFQRQDATYRFITHIIRDGMMDKLPILVLVAPKGYDRIQRREYFRLDIDIPLRFREILFDKTELLGPPRKGMIINLSAGGLKFWTDLSGEPELQVGDNLLLAFTLTNTFSVSGVEGRVLAIAEDSRMAGRFVIATRFGNITPSIQEAIIVHNIRYQQRYRIEVRGR